MNRKLMVYFFCFILLTSCSNNNDYTGKDYRLFKNTPAWNLAQAVQKEDIEEINRIVKEGKVGIDYQEPKYGKTLLMLAVSNQQYESAKALLELGADPNKPDNYNGSSAMIDAAGIENYQGNNTKFLKLLLTYGGNPNYEEIGLRQEGNTTRKTPLLVAASDVNQFVSPIEKVKVLVEAGANVNYKNEYNNFPLKEALLHEHYDVVLYLLNKGANYSEMLFDRGKFSKDGKKIYPVDFLREQMYSLESEKYKQKMKVVDFLKENSIDYRKTSIPDFVKKEAKKMYPDNWREYLEKY